MSKATITLEDVDGAMNFAIKYDGGFDKSSHAHQHANLIKGFMDSMAQQLGHTEQFSTANVVDVPAKPGLQIVTN